MSDTFPDDETTHEALKAVEDRLRAAEAAGDDRAAFFAALDGALLIHAADFAAMRRHYAEHPDDVEPDCERWPELAEMIREAAQGDN